MLKEDVVITQSRKFPYKNIRFHDDMTRGWIRNDMKNGCSGEEYLELCFRKEGNIMVCLKNIFWY